MYARGDDKRYVKAESSDKALGNQFLPHRDMEIK